MSDWDYTTDVLVVGSGGGALCTAITARAKGLDVLIIEKEEVVGGTTAMSGGMLWIPNNPLMRAAGIRDSEEEALAYFHAVVGDVGAASSPERRRAFVREGPRLIAFLQDLGIKFERAEGWCDYHSDAPGASGHGRAVEVRPFDVGRLGPWLGRVRIEPADSSPLIANGIERSRFEYYNRSPGHLFGAVRVLTRTKRANLMHHKLYSSGTALIGSLLETALELDVAIWCGSPLRELVEKQQRVIGGLVQRCGRTARVAARHAVVLATGGFSRSEELRSRFGGSNATTAAWSRVSAGDTGDALKAALELNAETALLDEAIWDPAPCMPDGSEPPFAAGAVERLKGIRSHPGAIIVDATGKRFVNESSDYVTLGQAMFGRNREARAIPSWLVFDERAKRRATFGVVPGRMPGAWLRQGFVMRADSLESLARECNVDSDGLSGTIAQFNEQARRGVDEEFHRGESAYNRFLGDPKIRPNNCLAEISRRPFYASALYPADSGTTGGVVTDEYARVLRRNNGGVIPGLYATGNVTATIMGRSYLGTGASIGPACTFGFIAAEHIAAAGAPGPA